MTNGSNSEAPTVGSSEDLPSPVDLGSGGAPYVVSFAELDLVRCPSRECILINFILNLCHFAGSEVQQCFCVSR